MSNGEFMRLIKEFYTLKYISFETIFEYLIYIKLLEERIAAINVILISDKQTILYLSMLLFEHLQYLIKIWDVISDMIAEKAYIMLLEEERKGEKPKFPEEEERAIFAAAAIKGTVVRGKTGKLLYKTCERLYGPVCWIERPDLAPEWY